MTNRITAILGVLLFLLGAASLLLLIQDRSAAQDADESVIGGGASEQSECKNVIQEVSLSKRVMTEKESQTLKVVLANLTGLATCDTTVRLAALDFELAPATTERAVSLETDGKPVTLIWVMKPRETGSFELAVTAGNVTEILGVVVTNVLGLTAVQIQVLSYLSTLLGPMLTAPWWYEHWQKRKKEKEKEAEKTAAAAKAARETAAREFRPE
ncbi:MAG: hypothetical protein WAM60_15095 [Candidatus Promineifilaceae bacterium]